jgi:hypothetical protein
MKALRAAFPTIEIGMQIAFFRTEDLGCRHIFGGGVDIADEEWRQFFDRSPHLSIASRATASMSTSPLIFSTCEGGDRNFNRMQL